MKRRLIYLEDVKTKETKILSISCGENLPEIELKQLILDYEVDKDKFDKVIDMHIEDGKVIFDRLSEVPLAEHEKLQDELLSAQAEIVELQFKLVGKGVK